MKYQILITTLKLFVRFSFKQNFNDENDGVLGMLSRACKNAQSNLLGSFKKGLFQVPTRNSTIRAGFKDPKSLNSQLDPNHINIESRECNDPLCKTKTCLGQCGPIIKTEVVGNLTKSASVNGKPTVPLDLNTLANGQPGQQNLHVEAVPIQTQKGDIIPHVRATKFVNRADILAKIKKGIK